MIAHPVFQVKSGNKGYKWSECSGEYTSRKKAQLTGAFEAKIIYFLASENWKNLQFFLYIKPFKDKKFYDLS